jgi:hypothetical protein
MIGLVCREKEISNLLIQNYSNLFDLIIGRLTSEDSEGKLLFL